MSHGAIILTLPVPAGIYFCTDKTLSGRELSIRKIQMNRSLLFGAVASALLALTTLSGPPAGADPGGAGCTLAGTADFTPTGPGVQPTFGYSLSGTLADCQSSRAGAPTDGTIEVGQVITAAVPITLSDGTVVQGTASYQAPLATGTGTVPANSCAGSSTAGDALITWADGTTSVVDYTTASAGPAVSLEGTIVDSLTATLVPGSASPAGTAPSTHTVSSTSTAVPVGDGAQGVVAFTTDGPDGCTTDAGLAGVDVEGVVGVGSTS